ncbi:hypothetical protein H2200_002065 [Cladophialophora chaetospira]|uniref:Uncharacterized protein n=1 Tax=Cladophialophora chaetospira TaxID=386627 RepID=A0AA39CMP8_9EURO|nr:hypothetical protein H2200_002065 [Cladophialophora chaetospira]
MSTTQPQSQLQQAYFISITDNGNEGFGPELFLLTFGPGFPGPAGAGQFGSAMWQQLDPNDPFTYSLVTNPNPSLEPFGSPPITGQIIELDNVGIAAGAGLTINLLIQGAQPNEVKKIVFEGVRPGTTMTAGSEGSTTPL